MAITQDELDANIAKFVSEHANDSSEESQSQTFWNGFFRAFNKILGQYAGFEVHLTDDIAVDPKPADKMDVFWGGTLLVEQKSRGKDLSMAYNQALKYFQCLHRHFRPLYIITCDFETMNVYNMLNHTKRQFKVINLSKNLDLFDFMSGIPQYSGIEDKVSVDATDLMSSVYCELVKTGYNNIHNISKLLTRLTYCMFADDTGIFDRKNIFLDWLYKQDMHGGETGSALIRLFEALNTPIKKRQIDKDGRPVFELFPHINGRMFEDHIDIPTFRRSTWSALMRAAKYDWMAVSPVIFGTLFQNVMDPETRHDQGAHYTSEENILKVIAPLFMDKLWHEFIDILESPHDGRHERLRKFQTEIATMKFLDPACGSGNFLILTYRELRKLEHEIILNLYPPNDDAKIPPIENFSKVDVHQFYGIDKNSYAVKITETGLWMMDHLMNKKLSEKYAERFKPLRRIPLRAQPNILHADALELDWNNLLPSKDCSIVMGNPPFLGARLMPNNVKQIVRKITKSGFLDLVTAWFVKAAEYADRIGFVTTNSVIQGEQVNLLWSQLTYGHKIEFAHKPFKWHAEGNKASVTVAIIGLSKNPDKLRLFDADGNETNPSIINPNLTTTLSSKTHIVVQSIDSPINGLPKLRNGTRPYDGRKLRFTEEEKIKFLEEEPMAEKYIHQFANAATLMQNKKEYILITKNIPPNELSKMPIVCERLKKVSEFRLKSLSKNTQDLANFPQKFKITTIPKCDYIAIPQISSGNRAYLPLTILSKKIIPSNALYIAEYEDLDLLGLLLSKMHLIWLKAYCGKLKSDFRYTPGITYNSFPVPKKWKGNKKLIECTQNILNIRNEYIKNDKSTTLQHLYPSEITMMKSDLKKAHEYLDSIVERLYHNEPFDTDEDRLDFLHSKYDEMVSNAID